MKNYTIFFLGEPIENVSIEELKVNLMRLFKMDERGVEKLFTGKPVIIKKNLPEEKARSYESALKKAGAKVVLKEQVKVKTTPAPVSKPVSETQPSINSALTQLTSYNDSSPQQSIDTVANEQEKTVVSEEVNNKLSDNQNSLENVVRVENSEDDSNKLTMLPPNSGSLEEFSHHEVADLPEIDHLSMSEPEQGDLEEFARKFESVDIPDISELDCVDNEQLVFEEQEIPEKQIDIGHISMSDANSGSLEEFAKHETVSLPDISHLKAEEH